MFENIECDWPLFFAYLALFHEFEGERMVANEYTSKLEEIMVRTDDGMRLVPEMYTVPNQNVSAEYQSPGSQSREVVGRCPFLWGQSLYILGKLLQEVSENSEISVSGSLRSIDMGTFCVFFGVCFRPGRRIIILINDKRHVDLIAGTCSWWNQFPVNYC